jgi:hypothetical protein
MSHSLWLSLSLHLRVSLLALALIPYSVAAAQQNSGEPSSAASAHPAATDVVPHFVRYSGTLKDADGKPINTVTGVTFLLYPDQQGGAPVWIETQNVTPDKSGHYTAQLGATRSEGMPPSVFLNGEARWLAVQVSGEGEQPRVLLVAVPYAMKAADAETVGGLPPSAFVLAAPLNGSLSSPNSEAAATGSLARASSSVTTTGGTANAIPLFTTATNIQNSAITQTGTGSTAKIGIGVTAPAAALDIMGGEFVRGTLTLPATATATATKGANSQSQLMIASVFNGGTSTAVNQKFQLQAEPAGNNTATASGTLNVLYGSGTATPAETGLKINSKGQITFAPGQTFPGTGTVTSIGLAAPASDFTVSGSPVTGAGTLNLAWKTAPTNADTANAIVKRDASGSFHTTGITGTGTFTTTTANATAISGSTSVDGGKAIVGSATAKGGSKPTYGVTGNSVSSVAGSTGVLGQDMNTANMTGLTIGVQGVSSNPVGMGVFGFAGSSLSNVFFIDGGAARAGVFGDGGSATNFSFGVVGTVDNGYAGFFHNNSIQGYQTLYALADNASSDPFVVLNSATNQGCNIDSAGKFNCNGSTSSVVPVDSGKRKVAVSAIESPQNWFEDAGSAQLVKGVAVVALDSDFVQTVNTALDYKVFPVANGDCKGLYVTNKTATSFEVRELGGGTSSVRFDYRIMALRKDYENVRFADHTNDPDPRRMMEPMKNAKPAAQTGTGPLQRSAVVHSATSK